MVMLILVGRDCIYAGSQYYEKKGSVIRDQGTVRIFTDPRSPIPDPRSPITQLEKNMTFEINPLIEKIRDLSERTESLRRTL